MIAMKELFSLMSQTPTVESKEKNPSLLLQPSVETVEILEQTSKLQQRPPKQQQLLSQQEAVQPNATSDDDKMLLQFEEGQAIENELEDLLSLVNDNVHQSAHENVRSFYLNFAILKESFVSLI